MWAGAVARPHRNRLGVRIEIVRCDSCTHLYPHPMPFPKEGVEEIYADTDSVFQRSRSGARETRTSLQMISEIESRLGRRGKILDIGCGRGELLWAAREAGWECRRT